MPNDHCDLPDHLTFSQRYGYEALPEPMKLEELSDDLRREIWNAVRSLLIEMRGGYEHTGFWLDDKAKRLIERVYGKVENIPEGSVSTEYCDVEGNFENICLRGRFNVLLDFLEVTMNDSSIDSNFKSKIGALFEVHTAAYWLDTTRRPYWLVPRANKEQGEATQQAVEAVERSGVAPGATTHLRQSVEHLNARRYADSIRDSIHAVESVARVIDPEANKDLGKALDSLERAGLLRHPALKKGFKNLFGYSSDEQGVRHALLERDAADVDVYDAQFMYGACASFAAYLVNKHQKVEDT